MRNLHKTMGTKWRADIIETDEGYEKQKYWKKILDIKKYLPNPILYAGALLWPHDWTVIIDLLFYYCSVQDYD